MNIVCLDLEGVLVPEIWIAFSQASGIPELKRTTRDEPDYDKLMKWRLGILWEHGLGLKDIQDTIATIDPMPGAKEFLDTLRSETQAIILSETAVRADPILRNIFPGSAGSDAAFGVANFGIIDIAAGTFVLHVISSFLFLLRNRLYAVSLSGLIISNGGGFVNRQSPGELIYFLPSENRR